MAVMRPRNLMGTDPNAGMSPGLDPNAGSGTDPNAGTSPGLDPNAGTSPGLDPNAGGSPGTEPEPVEPPVPVEPPPSHAEQPNTPLSIAGTFARPGTQAAASFRTPNFFTNRIQGLGSGKDERRFGPGVQISGGSSSPFGADEDEFVRQVTSYLRR